MPGGIDSRLPEDPPVWFLLFVFLLLALPVVAILAQIAPFVTAAAVGVVVVAWLLHRTDRVGSDAGEATGDADPLTRLQDRYARGEIDDDEFEHRLDRLIETEGLELADAADDPEPLPERER